MKEVAGSARKPGSYRRNKQIKKYIRKDERHFFLCFSGLSGDPRCHCSSWILSLLGQLTSLACSSSSQLGPGAPTPTPIPLTFLSASLTLGPGTFLASPAGQQNHQSCRPRGGVSLTPVPGRPHGLPLLLADPHFTSIITA